MQKRKSQRHVNAARARWRAAEVRAETEREAGTPDRGPITDDRRPFLLPLKALGWRDVEIEPRLGRLTKWHAVDAETQEALHSAALKELLHWCADRVPRVRAPNRNDLY
jgi:hypothetical protein